MRCYLRRITLFIVVVVLICVWWRLIIYLHNNSAGLTVGPASRVLRLSGRPFRILSGSFHYFRTRPEQWPDRLQRMRAAGLNTVMTYVPWNLHEPVPGRVDFHAEGYDLEAFMRLVKEFGMWLIVRPGPYICAEWDLGGLPAWLLADGQMQLRTSRYSHYLHRVELYFDKLLPLLREHTHAKNGPIIAFQVENEFGQSVYSPDPEYLRFLVELFRRHEIVELLFTADSPIERDLRYGGLSELLAAVNFNTYPNISLAQLGKVQPLLPLFVSEFWSGWFDHWGDRVHHTMSAEKFENLVADVFRHDGSSINVYMFVGGTNFGFWNGAHNGSENYVPTTTSYDYDALVSESGDIHPTKFKAFRKLLVDHGFVSSLSSLPPVPPNPLKAHFGNLYMTELMKFESLVETAITIGKSATIDHMTFCESFIGNRTTGRGWVLYRSVLRGRSNVTVVGEMHDRAVVLLNRTRVKSVYNKKSGKFNATFSLRSSASTRKVSGRRVDQQATESMLDILVENMGRVNFGSHVGLAQRKGFNGHAVVDGHPGVAEWTHVFLDFDKNLIKAIRMSRKWEDYSSTNGGGPLLLRAFFTIDAGDEHYDTFLDMGAWTKGIAIINGYLLGRYWNIGPQRTLYVPWSVLRVGGNELIIFEVDTPSDYVAFVDSPMIDEPYDSFQANQVLIVNSTDILQQLQTKFKPMYKGERGGYVMVEEVLGEDYEPVDGKHRMVALNWD